MAVRHAAVTVSRPWLRPVPVTLGLLLMVTLVPAAEAAAQGGGGRRARLSADLAARIAPGRIDSTPTSVIVTGSESGVRRIAARHGLRIRKHLQTGALLEVPAGRLHGVAEDPQVDAMSTNKCPQTERILPTSQRLGVASDLTQTENSITTSDEFIVSVRCAS